MSNNFNNFFNKKNPAHKGRDFFYEGESDYQPGFWPIAGFRSI